MHSWKGFEFEILVEILVCICVLICVKRFEFGFEFGFWFVHDFQSMSYLVVSLAYILLVNI
jgi:hypothetical protein